MNDTSISENGDFRMSIHASSRALLITSPSASVLGLVGENSYPDSAYCPFGFRAPASVNTRAGFNGQVQEQMTQSYLLGNGYRIYAAVMRRFYSPDDLSPFDEGGLNAYAYCAAEPINYSDPSGHALSFSGFLKRIGVMKRTGRTAAAAMTKGVPGRATGASPSVVGKGSGKVGSTLQTNKTNVNQMVSQNSKANPGKQKGAEKPKKKTLAELTREEMGIGKSDPNIRINLQNKHGPTKTSKSSRYKDLYAEEDASNINQMIRTPKRRNAKNTPYDIG
jgi:RHS repeat-associated protein